MVKFFGRTRFVLFLVCIMCLSCAGAASAQDKASLASWFGMEEDDGGMIQALDAPAVSHHGVEMKLGEVLIEDNRVYFSVHVDAGKPIGIATHQIGMITNGLTIGKRSFDVYQEWSYSAQNPVRDDPFELSPSILIVLRAEVPADLLVGDQIPMTLKIDTISDYSNGSGDYVYGPWQFDFIVDGSKAKELTRTIAMDARFNDNQSAYVVTDFVFSPIRVKIRVQRTMPKEMKVIHIYKGQYWYSDPRGNLAGFIVEDRQGNRVEIARVENDYSASAHETMECAFFSDANNNGWDWLKDAESVTLTPYIVTLAGIENKAEGIDRFHALESFEIELK